MPFAVEALTSDVRKFFEAGSGPFVFTARALQLKEKLAFRTVSPQ
jgi:hypothetical protein